MNVCVMYIESYFMSETSDKNVHLYIGDKWSLFTWIKWVRGDYEINELHDNLKNWMWV